MIVRWKTIPSFPFFKASELGEIASIRRRVRFVDKIGIERYRVKKRKILTPQIQNGGYEIVHLSIDDTRIARTVHSLVAEAFLGKRPKNRDVCHIDGVRTHNWYSNLKYDTRSNNLKQMIPDGNCPFNGSKLEPEQVRAIRALEGQMKATDLAKIFGFKNSWSIHRIWRRENWSHIE